MKSSPAAPAVEAAAVFGCRFRGFNLFEELSSRIRLKEDLYLQVDKLVALVSVQTALDNVDYQPNRAIRNHYSLVIKEHALAIRGLLNELFE